MQGNVQQIHNHYQTGIRNERAQTMNQMLGQAQQQHTQYQTQLNKATEQHGKERKDLQKRIESLQAYGQPAQPTGPEAHLRQGAQVSGTVTSELSGGAPDPTNPAAVAKAAQVERARLKAVTKSQPETPARPGLDLEPKGFKAPPVAAQGGAPTGDPRATAASERVERARQRAATKPQPETPAALRQTLVQPKGFKAPTQPALGGSPDLSIDPRDVAQSAREERARLKAAITPQPETPARPGLDLKPKGFKAPTQAAPAGAPEGFSAAPVPQRQEASMGQPRTEEQEQTKERVPTRPQEAVQPVSLKTETRPIQQPFQFTRYVRLRHARHTATAKNTIGAC